MFARSEEPSLMSPSLSSPLIFDILDRFRTYSIALISDIEKAFLQIGINKSDRGYLRFLRFDDVFLDSPKVTRCT